MSLPNRNPNDRPARPVGTNRNGRGTAKSARKGSSPVALGVVWFCFFCPFAAGSDWEGWHWRRQIRIQGESLGFVRLTLTYEILDESEASLQDLRILDGEGRLVPFVIERSEPVRTNALEWRSVRLINRAFEEGSYERVVLDFGEPSEKNALRVSLSGQNFRRRAVVEGSADSQAWDTVLGEAWLFDISSERDFFQVDRLDFPTNNFRFLRLTVYHMADETGRFAIDDVKTAMQREPAPAKLEAVIPLKRENTLDEDANASLIDLDLGQRNLPIEKLTLTVTDPFFYRGFELYGRNRETRTVQRPTETGMATEERAVSWQLIRRGVLFRVVGPESEAEDCSLDSLDASFRFLRLKIFNRDDRPLTLSDVAVYRGALPSLIFEADPQNTYGLIGGNPNAAAPKFDLGRSVEGLREGDWPPVTAGAAELLVPASETEPWTERHAFVLWAVLILTVALFAALILKSLKDVKSKL